MLLGRVRCRKCALVGFGVGSAEFESRRRVEVEKQVSTAAVRCSGRNDELDRRCVLFCAGRGGAVDGLVGGLVGGGDGEVGQAAVEGVAFGEALLGGGRVSEDGAGDVLEHAAIEEGGEGGVEEDGEGGGGLLEEEAVGELFGCATAEGEDGVVVAEGGGEGGGFEAAEVGFAVALEELGDGGSGAGFEVGVEVEEVPVEAGGEEAADGGFACSHESGEDEAAEVGGDGGLAGLVGHGFGFGPRPVLGLLCRTRWTSFASP